MLKYIKNTLCYSVMSISIITFINALLLIIEQYIFPLSSFSVAKLMTIAYFKDSFILGIIAILICVFMFYVAKTFRKEKILLPAVLFVYYIYDLISVSNRFLSILSTYNDFLTWRLVMIIIDIIIILLMIIYFILCLRKKRNELKVENIDLIKKH